MDVRTRLPSLTAARFFAAFFVLAFHSDGYLGVARFAAPLARIGYTGVGFFFVLSGFVLTWGTSRDLPARRFYRRRFARIWPLLAVALLVMLGVDQWVGGTPLSTQLPRLVVALLALQAWVPHAEWYFGISGVTWSLSTEAFFYAITPRLIRERIPAPLPLAVALLVVALPLQVAATRILPGNVEQWATYIVPLALLPCFLSGHLAARALREGSAPRVPWWVVAAVGVVCTAVAVGLVDHFYSTPSDGPFFFMGGIVTLMSPAYLLLIVWLAQRDIEDRLTLGSRPLVRLGEWSFALYLFHPAVLIVSGKLGILSATHPHFAVTLAVWLAAIAVSGIAYHVVERPLEDRLRDRRPTRPLPEGAQPASGDVGLELLAEAYDGGAEPGDGGGLRGGGERGGDGVRVDLHGDG